MFHYHHVFTIHSGLLLTVTAECLTALQAVCRISAAVPGFSRFLVNLRVDSAAISSSERSPNTIQPGNFCYSQTDLALVSNMSRQSCVYTHIRTHAVLSTHAEQGVQRGCLCAEIDVNLTLKHYFRL